MSAPACTNGYRTSGVWPKITSNLFIRRSAQQGSMLSLPFTLDGKQLPGLGSATYGAASDAGSMSMPH